MKLNRFLYCLLASLSVFMISCEKDEPNGVDDTRRWNGPGDKVNTSVAGYITDEAGEPLFSAQVTVGDKVILTDQFGYFSASNVSLFANAAVVKVKKDGYVQNIRTLTPGKEKEAHIKVTLLAAAEAGTIGAVDGGQVTTAEGAIVALPANGVVVAEGGAAYKGAVHVKVRQLGKAGTAEGHAALPGDLRGIDLKQNYTVIRPYVSIVVELIGDNGQLLQVATGKQATLTLPVPEGDAASAPASIALWYLDESTGLWKEDGQAVKSGNQYIGKVSHFSYWSGAVGYPLVNFTARITNSAAQPLAHVPVVITMAGYPLNSVYGQFDYTDANGYVSGALPQNTNFVLNVATPCYTSAYAQPFATTTADIDLGTLTGNLGQNTVTISGKAVKCNNSPVASGYVQTYDNGFYNRIPIVNGAFTFTGVACTNTTVHYITVDNTTNLQSEPQSISLQAGLNDLDTVWACGVDQYSFITYTINGVTNTLSEPAIPLTGIFTDDNVGWTNIITAIGPTSTLPYMSFQFKGAAVAGNDHALTDVFSSAFTLVDENRAYAPVALKVNISSYGAPGGFITGSFSGLLLGFKENTVYQNFSCSFKVRRQH